jgi:cytochrome oxidase Cu insertion factor (SCO1/SenC/PrrC family)
MKMHKLLAPLVIVTALLTIPSTSGSAGAPDLNRLLADLEVNARPGQAPPPPFTLDGLDGKRVSPAELRGRPALLYFWATW